MNGDYTIPVMMKIGQGLYKKAWAKSLTPNARNQIRIRYDSGKFSSWDADKTQKIENYIIRNTIIVSDLFEPRD